MKNEKAVKKGESGKGKAGEERRGGQAQAFLWSGDSVVRRIR